MQQDYEAAFHHFKPDKRLRWLQHIGTAVVKLDLADRMIEVEATPLQASISELFESQDTWDPQAMSDRLGVDVFQIKNGLAFWANQGVVKEETGVWKLLEYAEESVAPSECMHRFCVIQLSDLVSLRAGRKGHPECGPGKRRECTGALAGMSRRAMSRCTADVSVHQGHVAVIQHKHVGLTYCRYANFTWPEDCGRDSSEP
jgi:hypothetical protein